MREIRFRGKCTGNDKWVYGDLVQHRCGAVSICENPARYEYGATEGFVTRVDPKTVRQFTGLCDENKKEIYEGDSVILSSVKYHWENFLLLLNGSIVDFTLNANVNIYSY